MAKAAPKAKAVKEDKKTKAIAKPDKAAKAEAPKAAKGGKKAAEPVLAKAPSLKKEASKKVDKEEKKADGGNKILDLCLLLDCTGSMASWIQRSKDTLNEIITSVKDNNPTLKVRVCFVGYRDIQDKPRFSIHEFSEDIEKVKKFIAGVNASGGGDFPEDV